MMPVTSAIGLARTSERRLRAMLLVCVCVALGAGCSKKSEKKDSAASSDKAEPAVQAQDDTAAAATRVDPLQALADDSIPSEEDFEAEAEQAIGPNSNLSAELDKIEKELSE
mgnify:CR=1 FL=1